jgi:2-amino-4-hydroxy-6-hydroxymethyldihydropteridine diphosphokinase
MRSSLRNEGPLVPIGLGLGSNIGDRAANIRRALEEIALRGIARITARSSVWRTAPWGYAEQEDFANLCALAETRLSSPPSSVWKRIWAGPTPSAGGHG